MKKIKSLLCMVLCVCLLASLAPLTVAAASSGTCGENLTWQLDDAGVFTITGTGAMQDYNYSDMPWYKEKKNIKKVIFGEGITYVGDDSFLDCTNLSEIVFSSTLKEIGDSAFKVSAITAIGIPEGVEKIGEAAFLACGSLKTVYLPKTLTSIGEYAFHNTYSLENIYVQKDNPAYTVIDGMLLTKDKSELIRYCVKRSNADCVIPLGVKKIKENAFIVCDTLKSVTIPEGVEIIEDFAFEYCTALTTVKLPKSIEKMGGCVFRMCESLKNIYYAGSEEDWENAKIEHNWAHLAGEYTFHYNSINCNTQFLLTIGEKTALVNGASVENDVAPMIVNGRTMLPIRFLAEKLGLYVYWDGTTGVVSIYENTTRPNSSMIMTKNSIVLTVGSSEAVVNRDIVPLDAPAFIQDGRTFLPVRFIAEALGCYVGWDEETQQVLIEKY